MNCKFCGSLRKNLNSLSGHQRTCALNPQRKPTHLESLKQQPWNKGLTKKTDKRLRDAAIKQSVSNARFAAENHGPFKSEFWTDEKRSVQSKQKIALYKEFPEKHPNRKLANNREKMSWPEQVAFDWLVKNSFPFEHQKRISNFFVDFCLDMLIIEIDGQYWHDVEKDAIRDSKLQELGYSVHRISASSNIENELNLLLRGRA